MAKRTDPTEAVIHKSVAELLTTALKPVVVWTTVEVSNQRGGEAARWQQVKNKMRGVKTGWPDIQMFWPYQNYTKGLCIELKRKGGKPTDIQLTCHDELATANIPTIICRSVDEVKAALDVYDVPTIINKEFA